MVGLEVQPFVLPPTSEYRLNSLSVDSERTRTLLQNLEWNVTAFEDSARFTDRYLWLPTGIYAYMERHHSLLEDKPKGQAWDGRIGS